MINAINSCPIDINIVKNQIQDQSILHPPQHIRFTKNTGSCNGYILEQYSLSITRSSFLFFSGLDHGSTPSMAIIKCCKVGLMEKNN